MKEYKTINGTSFDVRTPDEVVTILENARQTRTRLHVSLGDSESGRDWLEENMVQVSSDAAQAASRFRC